MALGDTLPSTRYAQRHNVPFLLLLCTTQHALLSASYIHLQVEVFPSRNRCPKSSFSNMRQAS